MAALIVTGSTANKVRPRVAVVYSHFPHYREAVFEELRNSAAYEFSIFYSKNGIDRSIRNGAERRTDVILPSISWRQFFVQRGFARYLLSRRYDFLIFLGNPYHISTWVYATLGKVSGAKVLFWTHGWLKNEHNLREWVRDRFYGIADGLLLYGCRARCIGIQRGFNPRKLKVIFNSLDYVEQKATRDELPVALNFSSGRPVFASIARLVPNLMLETAIEALSILKVEHGIAATLLVIGDGPSRGFLEDVAVRREVHVCFLGEIYEEREIGEALSQAIAVISPGKVGLTAMHALAYGVPVITHNDFDTQMPEVEAIRELETGGFYSKGDAKDLARVLFAWIGLGRPERVRAACIATIEANYTPKKQKAFIESALKCLSEV